MEGGDVLRKVVMVALRPIPSPSEASGDGIVRVPKPSHVTSARCAGRHGRSATIATDKNRLVAGAGGVTVESIMKTLPGKRKISGFTLVELLVLLLLADFNRAGGQGFTFATNTYSVGNLPYAVVAANIKGDGRPALICANAYDNTLLVLTNDGNGGFGSNITYKVGNAPKSVTAADVNGDGWVDIICANYSDNTISVLTNSGNGGLVLASTPSTIFSGYGSGPNAVIAADVNGDGRIDLITANGNGTSGSLSLLTNNGSGGFGLATLLLLTGPTYAAVAADVNGDGKLDLICPNLSAGTLSVFTNNGSGGFKLSVTLTVGSTPNSVVATDINGDHKVDLICLNSGGTANNGSLTVFTNNRSGGFGLNATYNAGNKPTAVTAADINGDGQADLICAIYGGNTLMVYTNNGNGGFVLTATSTVGNAPYSVISADVNGDGKLDLVCPNKLDNSISVLINTNAFPMPASTPSVTMNPFGNQLLVSWPSASAGWSLQQHPDLATSNWSPSGYNGYPIVDDGTNKSLIITPTKENGYFRLLHP